MEEWLNGDEAGEPPASLAGFFARAEDASKMGAKVVYIESTTNVRASKVEPSGAVKR